MKRILLVDNYDSFTYNLVHYLESLECEVSVRFNDQLTDFSWSQYDAIVLSPGPGLPSESGQLLSFLENVFGKKPILGVCLGMQALALILDGELYNQDSVKHGLQEEIFVEPSVLFNGMKSKTEVGLYHSWAITEKGDYNITARSASGVVMAMENRAHNCYGVQFHPESIMTPSGIEILSNFLEEVKVGERAFSVE